MHELDFRVAMREYLTFACCSISNCATLCHLLWITIFSSQATISSRSLMLIIRWPLTPLRALSKSCTAKWMPFSPMTATSTWSRRVMFYCRLHYTGTSATSWTLGLLVPLQDDHVFLYKVGEPHTHIDGYPKPVKDVLGLDGPIDAAFVCHGNTTHIVKGKIIISSSLFYVPRYIANIVDRLLKE